MQGKLLLEGTIGDMKREFGEGCYQLAAKRAKQDDALYGQILRACPAAKRAAASGDGGEERYLVPTGSDAIVEIAALLDSTEAAGSSSSAVLGVERWSVECTSLQQIFMALVGDDNRAAAAAATTTTTTTTAAEESSSSCEDRGSIISTAPDVSENSFSLGTEPGLGEEPEPLSPRPLLVNGALWRSQLMGLWYKQVTHYMRDWRFLFSSFVIPPLLIAATMFLALLRPPSQQPPLLLTPSLYGPSSNSFVP